MSCFVVIRHFPTLFLTNYHAISNFCELYIKMHLEFSYIFFH